MVDQKQKAIDLIEAFLDNACENGRNVTSYIALPVAFDLYDRLALLREFPEEKFRETCASVMGRDAWESIRPYFKRLWEGDHIVKVNKKICQKCGGSKYFYDGRGFPKCPQCGGTGEERRSGEERRVFKETFNGGRRNYDYEGVALFVDIAGKGYEEQYHYDRRTLSKRRK